MEQNTQSLAPYVKPKVAPEQVVSWLASLGDDDGRTELVQQIAKFPLPRVGIAAISQLLALMETHTLESLIDTDWDEVERLIEEREGDVVAQAKAKTEEFLRPEREAVEHTLRQLLGVAKGGDPHLN